MSLRTAASRYLNQRAMKRHGSRVGWRIAPNYTRYLDQCRRDAPVGEVLAEPVRGAVEAFARDGIASFQTAGTGLVATTMYGQILEREEKGERLWGDVDDYGVQAYAGDLWRDFPVLEDLFRGDLGTFLRGYFRTHFKLFYGTLYRSVAPPEGRRGSQQWHSDGGPGTCINVMFYLHDMKREDGALEALPWKQSLEVFAAEPDTAALGKSRRDVLTSFYEKIIGERYAGRLVQPTGPAGLVVPFLNNTIHRGGFPVPGRRRTAMVVHCYPSHRETDFDRYRAEGIRKTAPYPADPAADF